MKGEKILLKTATSTHRIERLKSRYHTEVPVISVERARYYTESWKKSRGLDLSRAERVALAMKHVYENMTHYVSANDRIAGYWTEDFLGIPVDIERGVFNTVLETELDRLSMLSSRVQSLGGTLAYLVRERQLESFLSHLNAARGTEPQAVDLGLDTMTSRDINRFSIRPRDKKELRHTLLPYWKGKTMVDRLEKELAASGLMGSDMQRFSTAIPANTSRQTLMLSPCATIGAYQGHVIIDYETVLKKGLLAMHGEVARQLERDRGLSADQRAFLNSVKIAIEGVMVYAQRLTGALEQKLAAETDPARKAALAAMCENCRVTPLHPAETFSQAVQGAWTLKTAVELAHPVNLNSFGRMDQVFFPYFQRDVKAGRLTREEARELLEELLLKIMSQNIRPESGFLSQFYHRYLGSSPVTIGGLRPDGTDATNDLTYLFIEAAERSRAVTNVSVRVHENTPEKLLLAVANALYRGSSNLSLFNDDVNVEAMTRRGFSTEDARDYAVMGCVEMLCPGKTGGMSANALLLNRLLDITLRGGSAQTLMASIKNAGLPTGDPDAFETFEEFLAAFLEQARHQMELICSASNLRDRLFQEHLPAPYLSAFTQGCLTNKKDVTAGGAVYDLSGISFIYSIANVVDSLYVIRKLVFEQKQITFRELLRAIDHNFIGHEELHRQILALPGKWGNGDDETDQLARRLTSALFQETYRYTSHRGGVFVPYLISMTTHTIDGRFSIASADGRRAATPYAASCNPYNVEKNGVTSVLRSVAALDYRDVLGCAVNIKFHPTALGQTEDARKKWIALLRTYFRLGGAQLQPTVVCAQTLLAAQKNPGEYRDIIVKVGGYSAYFTELGREIQNEVIARTGHGGP